jgi:(p)ppGpp synthase/HD superfamily hydrolase
MKAAHFESLLQELIDENPFATHPVAVAGLVAQYGGDEDQQIADLLHDVLEDGGPQYTTPIAGCDRGRRW